MSADTPDVLTEALLRHYPHLSEVDAERLAAFFVASPFTLRSDTGSEPVGADDLNGRLSEALASVDNWRQEAGIQSRRADAAEAKIASLEALAAAWVAIGDNEGLTTTDDRVIGTWYAAGVSLRAALGGEATS